MKKCPFCSKEIGIEAIACKNGNNEQLHKRFSDTWAIDSPIKSVSYARLWKYIIAFVNILITKGHIADEFLSSCKLLDAGCGSGVMLRLMLESGINPCNAFGIDLNPDVIEMAKARTVSDVDYRVGTITQMPFDDSSFNIILVNGVFMYLDDEGIRQASREMRRVIRNDGVLFSLDSDVSSEEFKGSDRLWYNKEKGQRNFDFSTNQLQNLLDNDFKELHRVNHYYSLQTLNEYLEKDNSMSSLSLMEYNMDMNIWKGNYLLSVFQPKSV